jgi:hypothetical protein
MRGSSQDDAGMCMADEVRNEDLRAFHLVYDLKNFSQSCPNLEIHYGLSEELDYCCSLDESKYFPRKTGPQALLGLETGMLISSLTWII